MSGFTGATVNAAVRGTSYIEPISRLSPPNVPPSRDPEESGAFVGGSVYKQFSGFPIKTFGNDKGFNVLGWPLAFIILIVLPFHSISASDFFHMGPLEYFPSGKKSMKEGFKRIQRNLDWREPVLSPDGRMANYVPPQPVLDLLDDPTPAHARQYLAWQDAKMERVLKAQEVLAALEQQGRGY